VTIQVSKWHALYGCSGFNVGCMAFLTPLFGRVRPWRERSYGVAALPSDWDDAAKNEAMRRVAAEPSSLFGRFGDERVTSIGPLRPYSRSRPINLP
jgi:hypothetical protein